MNRRIVPFSLVIAGSLLAYACSSSDSSAPPQTSDEAGSSSGTSGTSGTSGSSGEGGADTGTDGSSSGNPIDGIAAPAEVAGFTAVGVQAPFFQGGLLYFSANPGGNDSALVGFAPGGMPYQIGTDSDPSAFGVTFDKKSSKLVLAAAAIAGGTGGGQILAFTPLATPPTADNPTAVTPTALTLSWGDSGATAFDSPSDIVAATDGTFYVSDGAFEVTDPTASGNITHNKIWRLKPAATAGTYDVFKTDVDGRPNGVALSPDGKTLYVAITTPLAGAATVVKYPVGTDGSLGAQAPFATIGGVSAATTSLTALAIDSAGNVYAGYATGIDVLKPADGTKWGTIALPASKPVTGLAFGGADLKTLYIGCSNDLYTSTVKVAGLAQ